MSCSYDGSGVFVPLFFDGLITGEQAVEALREFSVRESAGFSARPRLYDLKTTPPEVLESEAFVDYGGWKKAFLGHGKYPSYYFTDVVLRGVHNGRPSDGDLALCLRGDGAVPKQVSREELKAFLKATSDKFIPVIKELFC